MGGFSIILSLFLAVIGGLVVLQVFPSVKLYVDTAVAEWFWADATFLAVIGVLLILMLAIMIVFTLWRVISGE